MADVTRDDVLKLVEAIYQAATRPDQWDKVLGETTRLLGGVGALLEVMKVPLPGHRLFYAHGLPTDLFDEYTAHIVANSPRLHYVARQPAGRVVYDYQFITEQEMARDESYDFFARGNGKYFVGGVLQKDAQSFGIVTVQRSPKQGHADRDEIKLMQMLMPHFRGALELSLRWREVEAQERAVHDALNYLLDGALLLRRDGTVSYASEAAQQMARACDGFTIKQNLVQVDAAASRQALNKALESFRKPGEEALVQSPPLEIPVHRPSGQPPYIFTLRPIGHEHDGLVLNDQPAFILFVHDPLCSIPHDWRLIGEVFGLTAAEQDLAEALYGGVALQAYAGQKKLSMNTVYTHYRNLKDKMKCASQLALIKKLTDLVPRVG